MTLLKKSIAGLAAFSLLTFTAVAGPLKFTGNTSISSEELLWCNSKTKRR
jgi:hypothetical protein